MNKLILMFNPLNYFFEKQIKQRINNVMDTNKENQAFQAENIIRNHMIMASGAGFIPLPAVDVIAVAALQLDMLRQLCRTYNIDFREQQGKSLIAAITAATAGKLVARGAVKMIPVVGSLLGGVASSVMSGASTYALGHAFKTHFETGGTFLDFDMESLKKVYNDKFEKGKEDVKEFTAKTESKASHFTENNTVNADENMLDKLERLNKLKQSGSITDEEFSIMKKRMFLVD
ncbi:MAG: DUF697 domain-containing protein [Saprospiraceae bacterium]